MTAITQGRHGLLGQPYGSFADRGITRSLSDTLTLVESCAIGFSVILQDTLSFTELLARAFTYGLTDTLVFAEGYNLAAAPQDLSDTLGLIDSFTVGHSFGRTVTESFTLTETYLKSHDASLTESVIFTETYSVSANRAATPSDDLNLVESWGYILVPNYVFGDALALLENLASFNFASKNPSDVIALTETFEQSKFSTSRGPDVLSFGETTGASVFRGQFLSETIAFSETLSHTVFGERSLSDTIAFAETYALDPFTANLPGDALDLAEEYTLNITHNLGFCDCILFVEQMSRAIDAEIEDTLTFVDYLSRTGLNDELVFVESYGTNILEGDCCHDDYLKTRVLTDSIVFAESYGLGHYGKLTLADTLVISDSLMYLLS